MLNMAKAKAIILAVLVIVVASVAGYYAAIHYMQTKAVVQAEKDKQDEANKTKLQEQADKETAQKEKVRQKQALLDQKLGRAEEPDQVIRGLTADMLVTKEADGSIVYRYEDPQEEGIFLQPYIVKDDSGAAVMHVILRHRGARPMGFQGIDVQTSEKDTFHVLAQGQVATIPTDAGIMEWCDQNVDAETGKAMHEIAAVMGAKITMTGVAGGSNDDRMLSASEAQRIKNMVELCDILNGNTQD